MAPSRVGGNRTGRVAVVTQRSLRLAATPQPRRPPPLPALSAKVGPQDSGGREPAGKPCAFHQDSLCPPPSLTGLTLHRLSPPQDVCRARLLGPPGVRAQTPAASCPLGSRPVAHSETHTEVGGPTGRVWLRVTALVSKARVRPALLPSRTGAPKTSFQKNTLEEPEPVGVAGAGPGGRPLGGRGDGCPPPVR